MIAHRGASGERPENTLVAFELAVEERADMIEIDLHRSADGALVVCHDARVAGLEAYGSIGEAPLAAIRSLERGAGEGIPTLDEVLDRFGDRISFNLELKWSPRGDYPGLEGGVLAEVEDRDLLGRTLFSSFRDNHLLRLRDLGPRARIALLISRRSWKGWTARARALGAVALHPEAALVDGELVAAAHEEGLAVHPYTVDDPDEMARLIDLGVDGIFTNFPGRMRVLLEGR